MRRLLLCLVFAAAPALAACGASDGDASAPCDSPTQTTTVDLEGMAFAPSCVSATANDTLSLVNHDPAAHTFTVKGTSVNVSIDGGQTAQAPLSGIAPGTYAVVCQYHPSMTETLKIS